MYLPDQLWLGAWDFGVTAGLPCSDSGSQGPGTRRQPQREAGAGPRKAARGGRRGPGSPRSDGHKQQVSTWGCRGHIAHEVQANNQVRTRKGGHRGSMTKTLCSAIQVRKSLAVVWGEGLCACTTASPHPSCLQHGKISKLFYVLFPDTEQRLPCRRQGGVATDRRMASLSPSLSPAETAGPVSTQAQQERP